MYQIGKKFEDDGIWADYEGSSLKIGRAGSDAHLKAQEENETPYRKKIDRGTLKASVRRKLNLMTLSQSILQDWKGVAGEDGKEVAYTPELGFEALSNDPDLLEFVVDTATENENYAVERVAKIAKKSTAS